MVLFMPRNLLVSISDLEKVSYIINVSSGGKPETSSSRDGAGLLATGSGEQKVLNSRSTRSSLRKGWWW